LRQSVTITSSPALAVLCGVCTTYWVYTYWLRTILGAIVDSISIGVVLLLVERILAGTSQNYIRPSCYTLYLNIIQQLCYYNLSLMSSFALA